MSRIAGSNQIFRLSFLFVLFLCASSSGRAQTVVYDWSSNSKVPESYPKITRKQNVTFRITNVNDILYTYRLEVTQTPIVGHDFDNLVGLLKLFRTSGTTKGLLQGCPALEDDARGLIQTAINKISEDPKLPIGYAASSPHTSVPLRDSVNAWNALEKGAIQDAKDAIADLQQQKCDIGKNLDDDINDFLRLVKRISDKVNGPHVFVDTHELSPGNDVSVMVVEMFGPETISTKTFTFHGTDVLTLSAGTLFSSIPDRTYDARKSPASTLNVLTVEGNSRATPSLVGLLNYSLGALRLDGETTGLALSAGPVIKLGAKSDASSFGFFTGVSGHLYRRLYITPGVHFGQFADFPVGFGNGSTVPANFGELTPVKRWTARFGLSITFKAKDFSGLGSSDTPTVKTEEGGGSKPKEPTSSSGDGANTSNNLNPSNSSVARSFLKPRFEVTSSESQPEPTRRPVTKRRADVSEEPVPQTEENNNAGAPATDYLASGSDSRNALTRITSLSSNSADDRITINARAAIRDFSMYFKGGRFYLVIPHARLDAIEDVLEGRVFSQLMAEKRGNDFVLSFVLPRGIKASVVERSMGLELLFGPTNSN